MNKPIRLWDCKAKLATDDACTTIWKSILPPSYIPGPYETNDCSESTRLLYVPSLAYFCITKLLDYPEQVHAIGPSRLRYEPPESAESYDLLRALIPAYGSPYFMMSHVDPCLWAVLVQLYDNLPPEFYTYSIPLSDKHLPLLQCIPSTPDFSMITLLDIPGCQHLTDDTILELKVLHNLSGLDASGTQLSARGIMSLSKTLQWSSEDESRLKERRGPWALRILRLQKCRKIDNAIFDCLPKFLLLSVVDLRGTRCNPGSATASPFRPCELKAFYMSSLHAAFTALTEILSDQDQDRRSTLCASRKPFILDINTLDHDPARSHSSSITTNISHVLPSFLRNSNKRRKLLGRHQGSMGISGYESRFTDSEEEHEGDGFSEESESDVEHEDESVNSDKEDKNLAYDEDINFGLLSESEELPNDRDFDAFPEGLGRSRTFRSLETTSSARHMRAVPSFGHRIADHSTSSRPSVSASSTVSAVNPSIISQDIEDAMKNSIADRESREQLSRQAALNFYNPVQDQRVRRVVGLERSAREIVAPKIERLRTYHSRTENDAHLMLFRPPLSWSTLEDLRPESGCQGMIRKKDVEASVNRTNDNAKDGINVVLNMISRRKRPEASDIELEKERHNMRGTSSKNPFRRILAFEKKIDRRAKNAAFGQHDSSKGRIKSGDKPKPSSLKYAPTAAGKHLKPISALTVPVLPDSVKQSLNRVSDAKIPSKSNDFRPATSSDSNSVSNNTSLKRRRSENGKRHETPGSTSRFAVRAASLKSTGSGSSSKVTLGRGQGTRTFDWRN